MERIELSKNEKKVLRLVASGSQCPDAFPMYVFSACVRSLERKGLVRGAYIEGGEVEAVRLTQDGRLYLSENPQLLNPVDWKLWVIALFTAISALGGLAGFIALLKTCS